MKPLVAAALPFCAAALASAAAPNRDGLLGANKTHAAQTLSKGHLLVSCYARLINDHGVFDHGEFARQGQPEKVGATAMEDGYLSADYGITNSLEAAADFPVYREAVATDSGKSAAISPGEAKLFVKYRLPFGAAKLGWGAALVAGASAPTAPKGKGILPRELEYVPRSAAASEDGSHAFGTGSPELYVAAALTGVFATARPTLPWSWHLNAGMRKPLGGGDFDDVLVLSTAAEYQFDPYVEMFCEFHHETGLDRIAGMDQWKTDPTTLSFSGVASTTYGLQLQAGVSIGLLNGGSTRVTHVSASGDSLEGFRMKGAPPVSLNLGISWNMLVGRADEDRDGIPDRKDNCPLDPEDKDGFQDEDGCPDPDNDKDGIPDSPDKCPNQPETKNGYKDEDGCPDEGLKVGEKLVLNGVFFKSNSAELAAESYTALDRQADELKMSPEVRMQVLGHTDNAGNADANRLLSADRARSVVEYLVRKGIGKDRLKYIGYGPDQPIGDNETAAGREVNRRVELLRLED